MRQPPTEVQIVLPVWGRAYVRPFLELCLPTLLAQGNIPALAQLATCTFVLMTRERDVASITSHPLWARLTLCCRVRVDLIDDLVSKSSSTVLTLAYARAIRASGPQMVDTCFILLVSDYVVADGSLGHAAERVFSGASGVLAGNFQITEEGGREPILAQADHATGVITLGSRELARLALSALHPATQANIVGKAAAYDPDANRLFWRVDDQCMIGRFFLMHMIAIRPEVTNFVVGAPSDYCLIPELCPSGAIVAITDSDAYMTVECQPRARRLPALAYGAMTPEIVANSLEPWATQQHHSNIRHTLVFHGGERSPAVATMCEKSNAFVAAIYEGRPARPQPHRQHPFWARALNHHCATAEHEGAAAAAAALTGEVVATEWPSATWRQALLGQAPHLRPWHPRHVDLTRLISALAEFSRSAALLIVSQAPAHIRAALGEAALRAGARSVAHFDTDDAVPGEKARGATAFEAGLVLWPNDGTAGLASVLCALAPRLGANAIVVVAIGRVFGDDVSDIAPESVLEVCAICKGQFVLERVEGVPISDWRSGVQRTMMAFARRQGRRGRVHPSWWPVIPAALLVPLSLVANMAAARVKTLAGHRRSSSLLLFYRHVPSVASPAEAETDPRVEEGIEARDLRSNGQANALQPHGNR